MTRPAEDNEGLLVNVFDRVYQSVAERVTASSCPSIGCGTGSMIASILADLGYEVSRVYIAVVRELYRASF